MKSVCFLCLFLHLTDVISQDLSRWCMVCHYHPSLLVMLGSLIMLGLLTAGLLYTYREPVLLISHPPLGANVTLSLL